MPSNPPNCTLGYLVWHNDAERRHKAGQRQVRCQRCRLWRWRGEMCKCTYEAKQAAAISDCNACGAKIPPAKRSKRYHNEVLCTKCASYMRRGGSR